MLEYIIAYIDKQSFSSDYMSIASNDLQNAIQTVFQKRKRCVLCNIYILAIFHTVHGIWVKLVSNWKQSLLYTKS